MPKDGPKTSPTIARRVLEKALGKGGTKDDK